MSPIPGQNGSVRSAGMAPDKPAGIRSGDPLESSSPGLSRQEQSAFNISHKHSGTIADGPRIPATFIDWSKGIADGDGMILKSPNGTKYRVGVANDGALTTTLVT